jgi:formylglycine-generating enzyme required for sulfatase activity
MKYRYIALLMLMSLACDSEYEALDRYVTNAPIEDEDLFVLVKGGSFVMQDELNVYSDRLTVTLPDYYIGVYEVTQAQWQAVMGTNPSEFIGEDLPVENVSWEDVQLFLAKLNEQNDKVYRLPSEAEWEFAARGGVSASTTTYAGSNTIGYVAWYVDNSANKTHAIGEKDANQLGIYDMSGNVSEWCSDWYAPYGDNTVYFSEHDRVCRGGAWDDTKYICEQTWRSSASPSKRTSGIGFRLAYSF